MDYIKVIASDYSYGLRLWFTTAITTNHFNTTNYDDVVYDMTASKEVFDNL